MKKFTLSLALVLALLLSLIPASFADDTNSKAAAQPATKPASKRKAKKTSTKAAGANTRSSTARPHRPPEFSRRAMTTLNRNGEEKSQAGTLEEQRYDDRAYPQRAITVGQQRASFASFRSLATKPAAKQASWEQVGPIIPNIPAPVTYTGVPTFDSGRITSLAISPTCTVGACTLFVGAAGGGIWKTDNAMSPEPGWHSSGKGLLSNSIGSIIFDPTDPTGKTLYVGTGEPNGSGDSEAGVGLFKSTDLGNTWTLVLGSVAVAAERGIGGIAVDPLNSNHLYIGTTVARHGLSATYGGRFTPPGAPPIGLYESTDGGDRKSVV